MKINNEKLFMSAAPHISTEENTRSIMFDVIVALFFVLIMAIYFFGWRALTLTLVSVFSSVFFEWGYCRVMKKPNPTRDLSAVVTGLILALSLPVAAPYWMAVVGAFFAIVVVKQLYGGLGKNFLNPALAAKAFLFSWPAFMLLWTKPSLGAKAVPVFGLISRARLAPEVIASVTPVIKMKNGILPSVLMGSGDVVSSLRDVAMGNVAGYMGEVSSIVILAAAVYLIVRRVITYHIPVSYILTVAVLTFVFPLGGNPAHLWSLFSVLSGGVLFGAVFLATDYSTSPTTAKGRILYGIGCGVLTVFIRYFGKSTDGVTFAILIMNCVACAVDRVVRPRRFGEKKKRKVTENE